MMLTFVMSIRGSHTYGVWQRRAVEGDERVYMIVRFSTIQISLVVIAYSDLTYIYSTKRLGYL